MPYDRQTSLSLVLICNNRPTDSIHIIPYEDALRSRQCYTEHSSTEGIDRNGHVLVTNPNPVTTHASTSSVNLYPNMVARPETPSLANFNWVHRPHSNCSSKTILLKNSLNTITTAAYSIRNQFFKSGPHNFSILRHLSNTSHTAHTSRPTMSPPSAHNAPIAPPFCHTLTLSSPLKASPTSLRKLVIFLLQINNC